MARSALVLLLAGKDAASAPAAPAPDPTSPGAVLAAEIEALRERGIEVSIGEATAPPRATLGVRAVAVGLGALAAGPPGRDPPPAMLLPGELDVLARTDPRSLAAALQSLGRRRVMVRSAADRHRLLGLGFAEERLSFLPLARPAPARGLLPPPERLGTVAFLAAPQDGAPAPGTVVEEAWAIARASGLGARAVPLSDRALADEGAAADALAAADAYLALPGAPPDLVTLASSLRRAAIAPEGPAFQDVAWPGINALVYPEGDAAALAAVLLRLWSRPDEVVMLALGGPVVASARDPRAIASRLMRWLGITREAS